MNRRHLSTLRFALIALALSMVGTEASAQAPPTYYASVDSTNSSTLRSTLHAVIDDHQRFPYTSSSTDTWNILNLADEDPNNSSRILDIYRNASLPKMSGGVGPYNREHSWPKSYGFPDDGSDNYPYTDCHQLFLCDAGYNSSRSNKPFRNCDPNCTEEVTDFNAGRGGGSGFYPGNSNWTDGSFTSGSWQVWSDRRGDIARAMFYMDVRYEGGTHNGTGAIEPNLILTDNESLIDNSNTGNNENVAYMGMLSVLLQWHLDDPVDSVELLRNDVVYGFQGNRNPFVDHPEWVDCIFNGVCGPPDTTPPAAPTGPSAMAATGLVSLDWNDNSETDLAGYRVYRSTTNGGPYGQVSGGILGASTFNDTGVANGTTYYYVVTAEDMTGNESGDSPQVFATPMGGGGTGSGDPWINEFHYDNNSSDQGEFVEIAGPAGLDLSQWELVAYNGNGGAEYDTLVLSGILADQGGCVGTADFDFQGLQNGGPDGIALVDPQGQVIEFLSYEGSFVAMGGPANGMLSVDIGVTESGSTQVGDSLQRSGTGSSAADFTWQIPQAETPGFPNAGQAFSGGCAGPMPPADPTGVAAFGNDGSTDVTWNANSEPDLAGYNLYRSTVSGGGYAQLNGAPLASPFYHDASVINGTTYYYVVSAENNSAMESGFSGQVQATPTDMTPPAIPTGLAAVGATTYVSLDWANNSEPDLAGYNLYRSVGAGGPFVQQNGGPLVVSGYLDSSVVTGTEYYYRVTAVDMNSNESAASSDVNMTPADLPVVSPWINELHYLTPGRFSPQAVEIAGDAGVDLTGWRVVSYTSAGAMILETFVPAGVLLDNGNGFGVRSVSLNSLSMYSGAIALIDDVGAVRQFLSYRNKVIAQNGPAAGEEASLIPVLEDKRTAYRASLQLTGSGSSYSDFTWKPGQPSSFGTINTGQTLQP